MEKAKTPDRVNALRTMVKAKGILTSPWVTWVNRGPSLPHGEHCAITAMSKASKYHGNAASFNLAECMVLAEANRLHKKGRPGKFYMIPLWNDARCRTKRQVLGVFSNVIQYLYESLPARERKKFAKDI